MVGDVIPNRIRPLNFALNADRKNGGRVSDETNNRHRSVVSALRRKFEIACDELRRRTFGAVRE